jgi:hypothetical protein
MCGCTYGSDCFGSLTCAAIASQTCCGYAGCTWDPAGPCGGTAAACSTFETNPTGCTAQGCEWAPICSGNTCG